MIARWALAPLLLALLLALTGCFLEADREINLDLLYPNPNSSEVIVRYRVPPPPPGKLYVLWLLNPDEGKVAKVGQLEPSSSLRAIRATADFPVFGAIVSIESSPDVAQYSDTWALEGGITKPKTPTPVR
jgi:hypothetical protein